MQCIIDTFCTSDKENGDFMIETRAHHTDLAVEAHALLNDSAAQTTALSGVIASNSTRLGHEITTVRVLDDNGAAQLGKPRGTYITMELGDLFDRETDAEERKPTAFYGETSAFRLAAAALSCEISELLQLGAGESVLVAGLGNRAVTADSLGAQIVRAVLPSGGKGTARRHIFALEAGAFDCTGIESARLIHAVCRELCPDRIIVADALAAQSIARLCCTVQLSDAGIVPGSGTGRGRTAINRELLGVPVVAIGVPTVVDAGTLAADIAELCDTPSHSHPNADKLRACGARLILTPTDISSTVAHVSRLIACALNLTLHGESLSEQLLQ